MTDTEGSGAVVKRRSDGSSRRVIVVDDDPEVLEILSLWLRAAAFDVVCCRDPARFELALADGADALVLDVHMGTTSGLQLLERARAAAPELPVLMLTRDSSVNLVVEAIRQGARDYLIKPVDRSALVAAVESAVSARSTRRSDAPNQDGLLGASAEMLHLRQRIAAVAPTDVTLLICGETGSGKELVARAVHQQSARAGGPLVAVNCAAIPETLQDSELFGHERGAFTGALSRRIGRFEQANGGTFLLDEVGELSPALQAKLLRVLQERTFHRVGGSNEVSTDIRVVTATHRDLRKDVQSGRFRSDLFFRLSVFELWVPPLRERRSDVLELAEHFLHTFALHHRRPVLVLGESARQALVAYDWPGNVRELQSAVEHAAILAKNGRIELKDLPKVAMYPVSDSTSARQAVTRVERDLVARALAESGGNATTAMRRLGMPRSTFYRRLRQYGLLPVND